MPQVSVSNRVSALDTSLFSHVGSETSENDRRSLLAIHNAVAAETNPFSYLEIGSHLGGTLQALVADPRCVSAISIDPRPTRVPDDRGQMFEYVDNSTARMLELLGTVPGADLSKLHTVEDSTENIAAGSLPRPDICFVDGEHTYTAALRDARFCRAANHGAGIIVFHDTFVIASAIRDFIRETPGPVRAFPMRTSICVVELGARPPLLADPRVAAQAAPPSPWLWRVAGRGRRGYGLLAAAAALVRVRNAVGLSRSA